MSKRYKRTNSEKIDMNFKNLDFISIQFMKLNI